ncbi:IMPACT family protein [Sulfurimonas paralvinellae]|uniref:YigZ family protein n=1 Tax=Sulfurimonas paralvinellae TaxID=317658 RepID=A0A7M1B9K3_9BACT|nr:YigZ family protein [Sulfurimonas paralvinellae]QOP45412.1 YigZ family protein [Sulfurimonas paralvinellae]
MLTLKEHFTTTLEVKQSKFIAHLIPFNFYETTLKALKLEHPKARHFVTAYRYLNEYNQIVEHSSDDGEPKGTSGKPSLMVLQGKDLINVAVVIVRYFGGTKLGTGGLVRAYSDAVNLAIESAEFVEYKQEIVKTIELPYSDVRFIDYECEVFEITVEEKLFDTNVIYKIKASQENMDNFLKKVKRTVKIL